MAFSELHTGTIDHAGNITARPVVAHFDNQGRLLDWHYLDSHEPHSTTFSPTLLHI